MNEYTLVLLGALSGVGVIAAGRSAWRLASAQRWSRGARRSTSTDKSSLREFVYLDEVQLRSLLSSLTGEMVDTVSRSTTDAVTAEVAAAIGAKAGALAKAEGSSRLQASTTEMFQTSRKATVQSWFRDFYDFAGVRLITVPGAVTPLRSIEDLHSVPDRSVCCPSELLKRGELVEFRIVLRPDPTYRLRMLLVEFLAMAKEVPQLLEASPGGKGMEEVRPMSKMLDQLLAGLIPIRAEALEYRVVSTPSGDVVAHVDSLENLGVQSVPLEIVGVTEEACFWKDIRRLLFQDVEVTALARVSRSGLSEEWSPVKLVDLFEPVAPGLTAQIANLGRDHLDLILDRIRQPDSDVTMGGALEAYSLEWLRRFDLASDAETLAEVGAWIKDLNAPGATMVEERQAFMALDAWLSERFGFSVPPAERIDLRDAARLSPVLPAPTLASESPIEGAAGRVALPKLLDVEFVALYW